MILINFVKTGILLGIAVVDGCFNFWDFIEDSNAEISIKSAFYGYSR